MYTYQHPGDHHRSDIYLPTQQSNAFQQRHQLSTPPSAAIQQHYQHQQYWQTSPSRSIALASKPGLVSSVLPIHHRQQLVVDAVNGGRGWANRECGDPFNANNSDEPTLSFSNQIEQLLRYKCNAPLSSSALDTIQQPDRSYPTSPNEVPDSTWWTQQQQHSQFPPKTQQHPCAPPGLGHAASSMIRNVQVMRTHQAAGVSPSCSLTNYKNGGGLSSSPVTTGQLSKLANNHRGDTIASTILMPTSDLSHNPYQGSPQRRRQFQPPSWSPTSSRMTGPTSLMGNRSSGGGTLMQQQQQSGQYTDEISPSSHNDQYWLSSSHYFYQQRRSSLSQSTEDLLDPFGTKKKKTVVEQIADRVMKRLLRLVCEEVDESRSKRDASVSTHDLLSTTDFYRGLFNNWKRSWISATDAVDFSAAAFATLSTSDSSSTATTD